MSFSTHALATFRRRRLGSKEHVQNADASPFHAGEPRLDRMDRGDFDRMLESLEEPTS
jgi:hypothetical protein